MEFDILYPERREDAFDAECVIAAVFFDEDELLSFGVNSDSLELDDAFYDYNQFEKAFELWSSPQYLSDFYDQFKSFFQAEYWHDISEDTFLTEVGKCHHPFRFYAIEIEEKKCYLITGATIKVHKDMKKAGNTEIELKKLEHTLQHLQEKGLDTKDTFVTQAL